MSYSYIQCNVSDNRDLYSLILSQLLLVILCITALLLRGYCFRYYALSDRATQQFHQLLRNSPA